MKKKVIKTEIWVRAERGYPKNIYYYFKVKNKVDGIVIKVVDSFIFREGDLTPLNVNKEDYKDRKLKKREIVLLKLTGKL